MLTQFTPKRTLGAPDRILLYAFLPIGDAIFTLPTIHALRERYPHAEIVALAHGASATILRCVQDIDEVRELPRGGWRSSGVLAGELHRLRERRFDVAVDFTSPAYKWISMVCDVPVRTYMKFDPLWWLLPARHRCWRATHAAAHYYNCARELDFPPSERVSHVPRLCLPDSAHRAAQAFLRGRTRAWSGPLVVMHPGGAWLGGLKCWPAERFAALAADLERRWDARVLLVGDARDRGVAGRIAAGLARPPLLAAGNTPLLTSLALIAAADLFIGNDSGPLHAAAALGTPYVGIFGPTSPANFAPLNRYPGQGSLVQPARPCRSPHYFVGSRPIWWRRACCIGVCAALETIEVAAVTAAADRHLRSPSAVRVVGQ